MKTTTRGGLQKAFRIVLAGSVGLMLQACNQTIDARQANVERGLIYKKDASDPFSGTLNNVNAVEVTKRFTAQFLLFEASCTVPVQKGLFDGVAVCKDAKGTKVAEVAYGKGQMDGAFKVWAADTGNLVMSTTIRGGETDGTEEYFNPKTGKLISRVSYQAGKQVGEEKHWDINGETLLTDLVWQDGKKTGVYRSPEREEHYKAGQYDGTWKMCWWSDSVPLEKRQAYLEKTRPLEDRYFIPAVVDDPADAKCTETVYKDGVKQAVAAVAVVSAQPAGSGDACLDAKIAAFRKENGEEALINHAVIEEWEAGCKK